MYSDNEIFLLKLYLPNPHTTDRIWQEDNFTEEYSWFEFRNFFLDWLLYKVKEPIYGEGIHGFMYFPGALAQRKTQTA